MNRFRILSLDGGGIKGTFTASVLSNLEKLSGRRIVDHFDLITGTSTGGLIALGLGLGIPAEKILRFYVDRGPAIFPSSHPSRVAHGLRHAFRPKYSQKLLDRSVLELFGERWLGESKCRLVIPTFDCNAGRVQLFKTAHHERFVHDYRRAAREVAMATAAAPTYFPAFNALDGQSYLDGGIWANCPVVVGLHEAVFVLGRMPANVDVLSIGTTEAPFDVSASKRFGGLLAWNRQLVTLLMQAQIDGALAQARVIAGDRVMRIDAMARPGRFSLDDARRIEELRGLGSQHARSSLDEVLDRFLDAKAAAFRPCHDIFETHGDRPLQKPSFVKRRRRRRSLGTARAGLMSDGHSIVNISGSGALIETDGEMPVGNPIQLELRLDNGKEARVEAVVVRVQHPRWGATPGVGVRFTEYHGDAQGTIERFVNEGDGKPMPREKKAPAVS